MDTNRQEKNSVQEVPHVISRKDRIKAKINAWYMVNLVTTRLSYDSFYEMFLGETYSVEEVSKLSAAMKRIWGIVVLGCILLLLGMTVAMYYWDWELPGKISLTLVVLFCTALILFMKVFHTWIQNGIYDYEYFMKYGKPRGNTGLWSWKWWD